jgi:ribosomal-protein-alanine N-acetyltransferase
MLRNISLSDLPQLLLIEQLTQFSPWTAEIFERCLQAHYEGWVWEIDDKIAGFIISAQQVGENHILNIGVHPDYQRQGIGQTLVAYVLETAKKKASHISFLEVRRSNTKAIALYEKVGFVQIGERKNYYVAFQGREDALIFAKDLTV